MNHLHIGYDRHDPFSYDFSFDIFQKLIQNLPSKKKCSAKSFSITDLGLHGVGNGVIQDIFWLAKFNPKREMKSLTETEQKTLYTISREELEKMAQLGSRSTEKDLFNKYGGYLVTIHKKSAGSFCPNCTTTIEKQSYLEGSIGFCPHVNL